MILPILFRPHRIAGSQSFYFTIRLEQKEEKIEKDGIEHAQFPDRMQFCIQMFHVELLTAKRLYCIGDMSMLHNLFFVTLGEAKGLVTVGGNEILTEPALRPDSSLRFVQKDGEGSE